jgi:hypothetical protein
MLPGQKREADRVGPSLSKEKAIEECAEFHGKLLGPEVANIDRT